MTPPRTPTTAAGRAWLATPAGLIVSGMRDAILAIEDEAYAPLDVERVARIFHDRLDKSVLGHAGPVCQPCRQNAKDFAREYAKDPRAAAEQDRLISKAAKDIWNA